MPKKKPKLPAPVQRTKRTRKHIIADLSVNYVERLILESGHVPDRDRTDYGYDLTMTTFDEAGYSEAGLVYFQFKATDNIEEFELKRSESFSFPISMPHYHLWHREQLPVYFILYDAAKKRAYWLYAQSYFTNHAPDYLTAQTFSIHIPKKNVLRKSTIHKMRDSKAKILDQIEGAVLHHD